MDGNVPPQQATEPKLQTPPEPKPEQTGNSKAYVLLSEASKFTVVAAFVVYAIGFIVWHAFLSKYGTVPVEFLRAEYFSAALCYLAMLITFGLPAFMVYARYYRWTNSIPTKPTDATLDLIVFGWYGLSTQVITIILPGSSPKYSTKAPAVSYSIMAIGGVMVILVALGMSRAKLWIFRRCMFVETRPALRTATKSADVVSISLFWRMRLKGRSRLAVCHR
jgi:hypothetical protein